MSAEVVPSFCRNCLAFCPIVVTVLDGRAVKVAGDPDAPLFEGYTCPKGRALPAQHNHPDRLLAPLARLPDGSLGPTDSRALMDEVAAKVSAILAKHGPRSVAMYTGTGRVSHPVGEPLAKAWFRAIGSRMTFSAATIDKPAEYTSVAMHGNWQAGLQPFETSDAWMIVGANPVISKSNGAPYNNPGARLKEAAARGMKLVVIDPRSTETARRAHVHLQPYPGEDAVLLAGIIRIVIARQLFDHAFVQANAAGFEELKAAVDRFTPDAVARRAGVDAGLLEKAAVAFGSACRGGVVCSTGPSFSTHSNLTFYLALCLNTLCGRWAREGDRAPYANVLLPPYVPRAQPYAPYPVRSDRPMRVHGLMENASGMPTAALADEILQDGEGQVKALFVLGGNPVLAWPDQEKTEAALARLDLLVVFDHIVSETARFAHYVVPPPLSLEVPATTRMTEALKYAGVSRGYTWPWAQYTASVVPVPPGSDLLEDGAFFFGLAQRMGLQLQWVNVQGQGPNLEGPTQTIPLDMRTPPGVDEMIELGCRGSRIPLEDVKAHPHGHLFDVQEQVQPRDPSCTAMLQLADPMMMRELASLPIGQPLAAQDEGFPFRLICRRDNRRMNSAGYEPVQSASELPPACMHPQDLAMLGVKPGELLVVRSAHGQLRGIAGEDAALRRGIVSVVHGFGASGSVARLIDMSERDPVTGIPRMSAIPVAVTAAGRQP